MTRWAIVSGVVVGLAFVLALEDMARMAERDAHFACEDERASWERKAWMLAPVNTVLRQSQEDVTTVFPKGWECRLESDGRWACGRRK